MTTEDFLRAHLPQAGTYALAHKRLVSDDYWMHDTFTDLGEMAGFATAMAPRKDVYYALFTWPRHLPDTVFRRKGERAIECMVIPADLDVGQGVGKYPTQLVALDGLETFLDATGWPRPTIVSSGYGVHVYWRLATPLPAAEWKVLAEKVKRIFKALGLFADPAVTADLSRILRPVDTLNHKDPAKPRRVQLAELGVLTPTADFIAMVDAELAKLPDEEVRDFGTGDLEAPSAQDVAAVCGNFQVLVRGAATATNPIWYAGLQLVRLAQNGIKLAHRMSASHPDYQRDETQAKLDRLAEQNIGPTTCGKLNDVLGHLSVCSACPNRGLPKSSPLVFARRRPTVELPIDLPPPGEPYAITKRGVEYRQVVPEGEPPKPAQVISPYVIVPKTLIETPETDGRVTVWEAHVPLRGRIDVHVPADILGNADKMQAKFASAGVFLDSVHSKRFGAYMSHYIRKLQELRPEQEQFRYMGWTPDSARFILPDGAITKTGIKPIHMSSTISNAAGSIGRSGTMVGQIKALRFYAHEEYMHQQFMICMALGAPLLYKLRYYGLLVNIFGKSGASKSTCLFAAGGQWGPPTRYVLNGTDGGFTQKARLARMDAYASLPSIFDDTTDVSSDDMKSLIMSLTQAGGRVVLRQDRTERPMTDNLKASVMLTSSNNSMHALLSQNNVAGDAGSMRTIELAALRQFIHTMAQADAFRDEIMEHYGHIGPAFIYEVMTHEAEVDRAIAMIRAEVNGEGKIAQQERYWGAGFALALLACSIGVRKGWFDFDVQAMKRWIIETQLPAMRHEVVDNYASPLSVLQSFLADIANDMLVVSPLGGTASLHADRGPRSSLKARLETHTGKLWVKSEAFKWYCDNRAKVNFSSTVNQLIADRVITPGKIDLARYVEGYTLGQGRVYEINTQHVSMVGAPPIVADDGSTVIAFPNSRKA